MLRVHLETMGCQMNLLDSELVASSLVRSGMEMVDSPRGADVLLFNTCSVRQHAEDKVHSHVGQACQRKAAGKRLVVGVLGCMAQRMGAELMQRHSGLDIVCGPGQLGKLPELIQSAYDGAAGTVAVDLPRRGTPRELAEHRADLDCLRDPTKTHLPGQAFVRIMHGCDKFCSYCVVPHARGPEVSRSPEHIGEEIARLADAGVTQVTLLGQTVNSYRYQQGGKTWTLADLLELASGPAGIRRVRFITSYPTGFDDAIFQAMAGLPKVCQYLHVPAQSGSDRILAAMNRRYSRAEYDDLIDRARAALPNIAIAGDFIVGFPGETDDDFAASADLVRRSRYKTCYVFKYSPRPGTMAAEKLPDDVPEAVKKRRNNELLDVQEAISLEINQGLIGTKQEVLVEGPSPRSDKQPGLRPEGIAQMLGRTRSDHITVFDGPPDLAGQYVTVEILSATALTLIGRKA